MYHFLGEVAGKSPRTLKESQQIPIVLQQFDPAPFLCQFQFAIDRADSLTTVPLLMQRYNLLPNDAQIIAACHQNKISVLATYDPDFQIPCQ